MASPITSSIALAVRDEMLLELLKSLDGKASTISVIRTIVATHPARNANARRSPAGMPSSAITAITDTGLENATATPSTATVISRFSIAARL